MTRDRLEDLGRLAVIIENILDHEIFREERMRAEQFSVWFENLSDEKQQHIINRIAFAIPQIEISLEMALEIAKGTDTLNGHSKYG